MTLAMQKLTEELYVAPQVGPDDIALLVDAGIKSVMCNRPDGEEAGQPSADAIATAARAAGLETAFVPVVTGSVTQDVLDAFAKALSDLPQPTLAYCRSGTRCTMMWVLLNHGRVPDHDLIHSAQNAGYDMAPLVAHLSRQR